MATEKKIPKPPTKTILSTAPTVLLSPAALPRRPLAPRTRLQRFFSSEHLRDLGGTLAIVVPLTILIWIWAERTLVIGAGRTITIAIAIEPTPGRTTKILSPSGGLVNIELTGPNSGLDEFKRHLEADLGDRLTISAPQVDLAGKAIDLPLIVKDRLAGNREIAKYGLTISSVAPEAINVRIDEQKSHYLPIALSPESTPVVANLQLQFDPPMVAVQGSQTEMTDPANDIRVVADITALKVAGQDTNTPDHSFKLTEVPVRLIKSVGDLTLSRATVDVTVTVPQVLEMPGTVTFMPIYIEFEALQGDDRVKRNKPAIVPAIDGLRNIKVVGPKLTVSHIDDPDIKKQIWARITLTREDLYAIDNGTATQGFTPQIVLPKNVRVEGDVPKVVLKLGSSPGSTDAR